MKSTLILTLSASFVTAFPQAPAPAKPTGGAGAGGWLGDLLGAQVPAFANINGPLNTEEAWNSAGTGKYKPGEETTIIELKNHTIFRAKNLPNGAKSPVLVWGNGACVAAGNLMRPFLMQLASEGVTIFANGKPEPNRNSLSIANLTKYGQSSPDWMKQALDWADKASKFPLSLPCYGVPS